MSSPNGARREAPEPLRLDEQAPDYCNLIDEVYEGLSHLSEAERAVMTLGDASMRIVRAAAEGQHIEGVYDHVKELEVRGRARAADCRTALLRVVIRLEQAAEHRARLHPEEDAEEQARHKMITCGALRRAEAPETVRSSAVRRTVASALGREEA